jgi:hypothetical protein
MTVAKKLYENFEVVFKDGSLIKSVTLENREDKPWIKLFKSTEGSILIPKILKSELLINDNTKYLYV